MTHEIWHRIFIISGILAAFLTVLTLILIIRFRFFSLLRFSINNINHTSEKSVPGITGKNVRTEKLSPAVPARAVNNQSGGTVIVSPPGTGQSGTVVASDTFRYIRNTVITNADISRITSLCPRKIAGDSEGAGDQRECRARPQSPAKKQISQTSP